MEKSRLTEGKKCEQKSAKKGLCAICIVGYLEDIGEQEGYFPPDAAKYWRYIARIGAMAQNNSLERWGSSAARCKDSRDDRPLLGCMASRASHLHGAKRPLLYIEETPTVIVDGCDQHQL